MDITRQKLEEAGHTVIEWIPKNMHVAGKLALKAWRSDGGAEGMTIFDLLGVYVSDTGLTLSAHYQCALISIHPGNLGFRK